MLRTYGIFILVLLAFCLDVPKSAYSAQSEESRLKAVFVLNFAKLTEWPVDSRADSGTFTIAILGKAPSETFVKTLQQQTVHGAKVNVRYVESVSDAKGACLIYLSGLHRQRLAGILRELNLQGVLTVSDMAGFCEAGGMIGLVPVEKRLGFEFNLVAVRQARLTVSSQLLKLAKTIIGN